MAAITLTVNGHQHQVAAEADTPLLYVLHPCPLPPRRRNRAPGF